MRRRPKGSELVSMPRGRFFKAFAKLVLAGLLLNLFLGFVTNVPTNLSSEDIEVFEKNFARFKNARAGINPEAEIQLVREIQRVVLQKIPFGPGIPEYSAREPADVLKRDTGLCYDRSRLFDKLYLWAGFETRHVYILYRSAASEKYFESLLISFFMPRSESHAVTEVKTSRGWVLVDSNDAWISVNRNGGIVSIDHIWRHGADFDQIPDYFLRPFWAIRGLYSRRGHLYRPYFPYPQLNWRVFFQYYFQE